MVPIIEFDEECKSCKGTGVYVGMAERDGYAVQCYTCDGTGKHHFKYEYKEYSSRHERNDVKIVMQSNPGICLGGEMDFGGISYKDWLAGKRFGRGTEMRRFTCPAWWFQSVDYDKKPDWDWCEGSWGKGFSSCPYFSTKDKCWERHDKEYKQTGD